MSGPSSPSIDTAAIGSAQAAAARALATGVNPREIFVPRPSATAAQLTAAAEDGYVTPLYQSTPAPVGLAEYGLKADPAGHLQPFVLNTTSVRATFDPSADGGPNATYLLDSTPDGYGVQLNAVVTNITLFDHDGYEFWTQNVMEFFPYTGAMLLTTNVWNWSSSSEYLSPNVFYAHGPNGTQEGSTFYVSSVGPLRISYPFNLTLTMVSNVTGGRDSVYFSANVTSPSGDYNRPDYDYVIFNSLGTDAPGLTTPSNYSADGFGYNPIGGTNDFELTIGGPGSGSQTTLLTSNASESLDYWNASTGSYHAIPSAYTYGDETGETSIGAAMSWATRPDGSPYGIMTTGPSLLGGLWNASSPSGGPGHLQVVVRPSNAFVFIADKDSLQSPFNVSAPEWAPTVNTDSFTLPSGVYQIFLAESDYNERSVTEVAVTAGSSARVTEDLTWNSSEGVYTPLWAWTNAQIANLSTSGNGTQANPYQIVNQQNSPILEPFGALNDLGFPVFPGVYFLHTTAYTEFVDPPSLTAHVSTNSGHTFPTYNDLPWWFYEDANVAITGAQNVSGWFAATASDYPADSIAQYLAFNVIVLNSSGFLIAHDDFQTEARGLLLSGGTDNVVWGNTFLQLNPPSPSSYLAPFSEGMAVVVLETGDLVYNNLFSNSPITAASGSAELYFHHPVAYTDTWNITPQSASEVHRASNWPAYALTGSVIGGTIQGGNFWWDYGMKGSEWFHSNPYGVLPYNESSEIAHGGDDAPLLYSALYTIQLTPVGLASGAEWSYSVLEAGAAGNVFYSGQGHAPTNTDLSLTSAPVTTYEVIADTSGFRTITLTFTVTGNATVDVRFAAQYQASFTETGLPSGTAWSVDLNGTTLTFPSETIEFSGLVNGSYNFTVRMTYGYSASPSSGTITVRGANVDQAIAFSAEAPTYSATFTRSGLPTGTNWSVTVDDVEQSSTTSAIVFAGLLTNGTWPYELGAVVGFVATPSSGTLNVAGANVTQPIVFAPIRTTYPVTFTETGLPSGTNWSVRVDPITEYSTTPSIVFQEPNGTYLYTSNPSGSFYAQSDASGVLTVHGAAGSVSVPYAYSYVLTFTETGLPTELIWSVNVTGTGSLFWENDSFGSTLTFHLPNGTYEYTVTVPHGYSVSPSSGSATIQGAPVPVALVTVSPTSTTSSSFPWILVIVGVVVIAVLIAVVAIWVRRRGRSGPAGGRGATPGPGQPGRP